MQLGDLFANLSYGSLSNLAIGGEGSGVIPAQHEPRLVSLTNQALKLLSGKFLMCEKEVIIRAIEGRAIYPLEYEFAESNTAATGDKFIVDTVEQPFMEDVVTVLEIYDELNQEMAINDASDPWSLFTPSTTTLQIPFQNNGDFYYVLYQALHPKLVTGDLTQELKVPPALQPALQAHVGYQIFSGMNGPEHAQKAGELITLFDTLCAETEAKNLVRTSTSRSTCKFSTRGFK